MKSIRTIVSTAALLALATTLNAASFLRPYAAYVNPSQEGYSDAGAVGFALGIQTGTQEEHEFSFDWSYTRYDSEGWIGGYSFNGTEKYMPYLASYRFVFGKKESRARLYVGPSLGYTNIRADASVSGYGVRATASCSAWAPTGAGSAGVLLKLTDMLGLDVGYRYIHIGSTDVKVAGVNVELGDVDVHSLYAGLSFRF
jgi:opacity protein-like surface antigen